MTRYKSRQSAKTFSLVESEKTKSSLQTEIMHATHIVHLSAPLASGDLVPQIWQGNLGTKLHDQILFEILPCPPAAVAREAHHWGRIVFKL
jgi:hypothetical protein